MTRGAPRPDDRSATPEVGAETPVIVSEDLFGNANELLIRHQSDLYRLRITRAGKLILTK